MALENGITGISSVGSLSPIGQVSGRNPRVDFFAPASSTDRTGSATASQAEQFTIRQREADQRREDARERVVDRNAQDREDSVARLNDTFGQRNFNVRFAIDSGLDRVIIRVLDKETNDLIRQVPLEGLLDLSRRAEGSRGLLLNEFA